MTTLAYIDCPSGVSGDMLLGALVDAGVSPDELRALLQSLPLDGYTLTMEPVRRGSLGATQARVALVREETAHRHLSDVLAIVDAAALPTVVKENASTVFRQLAAAEARVHRVSIDEVHFHEVGAVDAIVDIVGVCAGLRLLGVQRLYASPLPLGRGQTSSAHGPLPLPAPAVLELVAAAQTPTVPHPSTVELVTPSGAALLTTLAHFEQPAMTLTRIGYGAGSRSEPAPNLLRLWLGEDAQPRGARADGGFDEERLLVLEANIDDMPAEFFGHAVERLLAAGALDAWCVPATMKKTRPATVLCVLCRPTDRAALLGLLVRETSTFGVRAYPVTRHAVPRETRELPTPFGAVRVKFKILDGTIAGAAPEYEDCRLRAAEHDVPLPRVYIAAMAAAAPLVGRSASLDES